MNSKKIVSSTLSIVLAASMIQTRMPYSINYVKALEEELTQVNHHDALYPDGIYEDVTVVNKSEGSICAVEDGWLHMMAGNTHDNATNPALMEYEKDFDFNQTGFIEFTMKSLGGDHDRFGVYLGYEREEGKKPKGMFLGFDASGWFWQKYGEDEPYYTLARLKNPEANVETKVRIEWTNDKKVSLKINDQQQFVTEQSDGIIDATNYIVSNKIAFKCAKWGSDITNVLIKDLHYSGQKELVRVPVSGIVLDQNKKALSNVKVSCDEVVVSTNEKGVFEFHAQEQKQHEITFSKQGYKSKSQIVDVSNKSVVLDPILLEQEEIKREVLSSNAMDVYINTTFPSVYKYVMKGNLLGKEFCGQQEQIDLIRINGKEIHVHPEQVLFTLGKDRSSASYHITLKDEKQNVDCDIVCLLAVKDNTLSFEISEIHNHLDERVVNEKKEHSNAIQTIEIPNHSLVSVNSKQAGANVKGALMSTNTTISGDEEFFVDDKVALGNKDYMYAFIQNKELSAGLWSNSEHDGRAKASGVRGGSHNTRVMVTTTAVDGYKSSGLSSTKWYWHRSDVDSHGRHYLIPETSKPQAKIVISGNCNGDDEVDWQDGAVAYRKIMNQPYRCEEVPELVAYRIAMNFGSQAQNPFLTTLDNVKKVALHTDGLGQSIILKGYANEGHDSAHPDYADIGKRIGGAKDMNMLMEKGHEYGAKFGIHVNAGEMYPEAKAFKEDNVRRNSDQSLRYGWNWIDQGIGLDSLYDLASGERNARFQALKDQVGNNLDFVYLDIWGNATGGSDDSWQTRKVSKEITSKGWRMSNEWGAANEYDATFQHWATDLTYGGFQMKGQNSQVMRFLRNHQKDSWIGDFPSYKGVANAPLLGGYNMKDFEGWQGRNDYDTYITNLYTHDLTTKFIQHFEIMDWELGTPYQEQSPVYSSRSGNYRLTYTLAPDKEITLKKGNDTLVLKRESCDIKNPNYRKRTMILNGKVIGYGAVSSGDRSNQEIQKGLRKGDETYLLPWIWDAKDGSILPKEKQRLYHWNTQGGTTTWELPTSWQNVTSVTVYRLSDLGKCEEQKIPVVQGKITLLAKAETPYVVYRNTQEQEHVVWSEGMHIVDAGFNSGSLAHWKKEGSGVAQIVKSQYSNPMLKLSNTVSMTQTVTDLTPGKQYAILVGVDNRSDAKASITVKVNGVVADYNYTNRSIAKNYVKAYTHNTNSATVDGTSYFQNMYVYVTAKKGDVITLTLEKEQGEGDVYFDDIRIVENEAKNIVKNKKGQLVKFTQDFEHNVQGLYPFVVGGIEGVEDNRIHLSQLHAPYTQAGWDVKKMDDVLDGEYSLKVNGLCGRYYANKLAYQTIPQNVRFEPGVTYKVSFNYQQGSNFTYAVVVGSGEFNGNVKKYALKQAMGKEQDGTFTTEIVGDASGNTWFGIYSTGMNPNLQGTSGAAANFGGYKEIVIDNVVIERVDCKGDTKLVKALIEEAKNKYNKMNYDAKTWNTLQKQITKARVAMDQDHVNEEDLQDAYYALKGQMVSMDQNDGMDASDASRDLDVKNMIATAGSEQEGYEELEGPATLVLDNDEETLWHTVWDGCDIKDQWINIHFKKPQDVGGIRFLQRKGNNGVIKEADLYVKEAGAKDYKKVMHAKFNPSGWQGVNFEEIKNVSDIKIQPTATTGSVENRYSALAELRVLSAKKEEAIKVDHSELSTVIKQVESLKEKDYTRDTWKQLQTKLRTAKQINDNTNASMYEVELAKANLQHALTTLVKQRPIIITQEKPKEETNKETVVKIETTKEQKASKDPVEVKQQKEGTKVHKIQPIVNQEQLKNEIETADTTNIGLFTSILVLSALSFTSVFERRNKK